MFDTDIDVRHRANANDASSELGRRCLDLNDAPVSNDDFRPVAEEQCVSRARVRRKRLVAVHAIVGALPQILRISSDFQARLQQLADKRRCDPAHIDARKIKLGPRFEYDNILYSDYTETGWKLTPLMLRVVND